MRPSRSSANRSEARFAPPLSMMATSCGRHFTARPCCSGSSLPSHAKRLAQRAAHALEAGLDHVVRVFAAHLTCIAAPRVSASERKKCGTSSVGRPPTASRPNCPRTRSTRGRTGRSPPAPAPRPSAAGSRSARCRACRPAPAQRLAERQRAVLDRVVLVDVQVALAGQLQREAAVPRQLLQHVVEEADAGGDRDRGRRDPGRRRPRCRFPWCVASTRATRSRPTQPRGDRGPGLAGAVAAHAQAARRRDCAASCRSVSRSPITELRRRVDRWRARYAVSRPVLGLRQSQPSAGMCGQMNSASKSMPCEANSVEHEVLRLAESALRERRRAEAVLVGDHHQPVAGARSSAARRTRPAAKRILSSLSTCSSARLLDQRAVTVDEQDAVAVHQALQRRQQAIVLFRRADGDAQAVREPRRAAKSRTSRPAACRRSSAGARRGTPPAGSSRRRARRARPAGSARAVPRSRSRSVERACGCVRRTWRAAAPRCSAQHASTVTRGWRRAG